MSSGNSFQSVGAAIVPGYNAATFDPKFFIEVDEVVPGPVEIAVPAPVPVPVVPAPGPVTVNIPPAPITVINNIPPTPAVPVQEKPVPKKIKKWHHNRGRCLLWEK
jgi:hypothetical protein